MNDRRRMRVVSLALLCLLLTGMVSPALADEKTPVVREILSQMGELAPVDKTNYLLAREFKGTAWGVYNTDGEKLVPCEYASLSYLSFNCFDAGKKAASTVTNRTLTLEEINSHALVTADGTLVSDYLYGAFKVLSAYWACGWILGEGSEEANDYKLNGSIYRIERCDVFYLGDHAVSGGKGLEEARLVASLTRDEYKDAAGHGKYLYVQNRQDEITAYDSSFRQLNIEVKRLTDSMYAIKNWMVVVRENNLPVMDGFSAVEEVSTVAGTLLKATRIDVSGVKWTGVYTETGEELMPLVKASITTLTPDYAVLTTDNKKMGLYSIREHRVLLPCLFDKIIACDTSLDPYLLHGFLCAEIDGTRIYIEDATGRLYLADNAVKGRTQVGNTYYLNDRRSNYVQVYAPDQVEGILYDGIIETASKQKNRGTGYLFSANTVYNHMLITWHGEILLKFHSNLILITDDDRLIIKVSDTHYKLSEVVQP